MHQSPRGHSTFSVVCDCCRRRSHQGSHTDVKVRLGHTLHYMWVWRNEHRRLFNNASAFFGVRPERKKRPLRWEGYSAPHPPTMQSWLRAVRLESRSALRNKRPLYAQADSACKATLHGRGMGWPLVRSLKICEGTFISLGTGRDPVVFYPGIHGL